jgi:hypothetical protein
VRCFGFWEFRSRSSFSWPCSGIIEADASSLQVLVTA